jgi:hypothetical protein
LTINHEIDESGRFPTGLLQKQMMECLISTSETAINKNFVDKGTSSGDIGLQSDRLVVVKQKVMRFCRIKQLLNQKDNKKVEISCDRSCHEEHDLSIWCIFDNNPAN